MSHMEVKLSLEGQTNKQLDGCKDGLSKNRSGKKVRVMVRVWFKCQAMGSGVHGEGSQLLKGLI